MCTLCSCYAATSWRNPISHHCGPEAYQSPHKHRVLRPQPRCNKALIQRVRCLLTAVRRHHDLAISWVKAHTGFVTPEAVGNANADRLAARGRTGSTGVTEHPHRPPLALSGDALLVAPRTLVDACGDAFPFRQSCALPILPITSPSQLGLFCYVSLEHLVTFPLLLLPLTLQGPGT